MYSARRFTEVTVKLGEWLVLTIRPTRVESFPANKSLNLAWGKVQTHLLWRAIRHRDTSV